MSEKSKSPVKSQEKSAERKIKTTGPAKAATKGKTVPKVKTEAPAPLKAKAGPKAKAPAKTKAGAEVKTTSKDKAASKLKAAPKAKAEAKIKAVAKPKAEAKIKAVAKPKAEAKIKAVAKPKAEAKTKAVAKPKAEAPKAKAEPKVKAGGEPKAKAAKSAAKDGPAAKKAKAPRDLADIVAAAASEHKAIDPVLLDLSGLSSVADWFFIVSADNPRQMSAIAEKIIRRAREHGCRPLGSEGLGKSGERWVLVDLGDVVVHIFNLESRELYDLEGLWTEAPRRKITRK